MTTKHLEFEACLPQASLLKRIIDSVKDLVHHAIFDCTESGVTLQAMDPSHIALCALKLRRNGFDPYHCERNISICLDLNEVAKVLRLAGPDDSVTISADSESEEVTFLFEGKSQVASFDIKQIDVNQERLGIKNSEYKAEVQIPSRKFQQYMRDLGQFDADYVTISVTKNGVSFAISGDSSTGCLTLSPSASADEEIDVKSKTTSNPENVSLTIQEPVTFVFPLRYLNHFAKAATLAPYVTLSMSPLVPLRVNYNIEEVGWLRYFLAPKSEDSDDESDEESEEEEEDNE